MYPWYMPLPRFVNLNQVQRDELLSAATAEFAAHGYAEASLNQILKAAGLSKGTLYYYFADRDDLYAYVVLQAGMALRAGAAFDTFEPTTPVEFERGLIRLAQSAIAVMREKPTEMKALRSFQRDLRRLNKPVFAPLLELARQTFLDVIRRGRKLGVVRDDVSESLLVEMLESADEVLDRTLYAGARFPTGAALERHLALVLDTFRRILEPRQAPARREQRPARSKGK